MRLTERLMEALNGIRQFGCLTSIQVSNLLFWHIKPCQRGLTRLHDNRYLGRMLIKANCGRSPYLYFLGPKAAALFDLAVSRPRLSSQLTHAMKNADLLIQVSNFFHNSPINCKILPEHILRTNNPHNAIIPDGSFLLQKNTNKSLFLLEYCSGTEIVKSKINEDVEIKIIKYTELFKNNDVSFYEDYFGMPNINRFRVLYIAKSSQRMVHVSEIVKELDEYNFIWLTTLDKFHGITGNIWHVPSLGNNMSII